MHSDDRIDRRHTPRHKAKTKVRMTANKISEFAKVINMSSGGILVKLTKIKPRIGSYIALVFVINLGTVQKLIFKTGVIAHNTNGTCGIAFVTQRNF